ncbi:MAG: phage tail tip lysozyme [Candidatus Saccharibacteria bacterium]
MAKRQGEILSNNEQSSTAGIVLTLGLIGVTIFGLKIQNGNFYNPLNNVHFNLSTTTEKTIEVEPVAQLDRTSIASRMVQSVIELGQSKSVTDEVSISVEQSTEVVEVEVAQSDGLSIASRMVQSVIGLFESDPITLVASSSVEQPAETYDMNKIEKEVSRQQKTESEQFAEKAKIALENKDYEVYTWNYLRSHGYTAIAAAAIMGNAKQESNLNPKDIPVIYNNGAYYGGLGLFQFGGLRATRLKQMFPDSYEKTESQLAYAIYELTEGEYKEVGKKLLVANDLATAVEIFQNHYEKCNIYHCNFPSRNGWAEHYFIIFNT